MAHLFVTFFLQLTGPCISLPPERIQQIQSTISVEGNIGQSFSSFRAEFQKHNQTDFFELLESKASLAALSAAQADIEDDVEINQMLFEELFNKADDDEYLNMLEFRQKLPAYKHKDEIIELIENHQVTLIEGNTGCGKTTQVPQYILDDALVNLKGSKTRILCTQPRRIAAISIAERVASERSEELGLSVGYQIRLEKTEPRVFGSIKFCTTGVLLKFMEMDPSLKNYSHILIDEIHERNVHVDVCLALIKQIVLHRKDLKIILMSATLNAESFSKYFNDCPKIHIEGFTFGVQELYLEDVLEETGFDNFSDEKKSWASRYNKKQRCDDEFQLIVGNYANSLRGKYSKKTIETLNNPDTERVNVTFIEHLIRHISYNKPPGAILVILPGYTTISKLHDSLQKSPKFPSDKFVIYPLHSLLNSVDQKNIFKRPPEGVRKIIVSTPLAETSITIDDVVYVINAGKMRKPYHDFERNAKIFEDQWITKANETQRKGRAGRVQEGICFHLYTRARSNSLEPFEKPEILIIRLEEVLLTFKVLCIKDMKRFMSTLIDVPEDHVVQAGTDLLQRLGALAENEDLTPLGLQLSRLAVGVPTGKMLLLSSIFSCVDPITSIAAGLEFKTPFYNVMGKEKQCNEAKRRFSNDSDQLAVAVATKEWKKQGHGQRSFCFNNFLSQTTMIMLDRLKNQFTRSLYQAKFLSTEVCDDDDNNQHSENDDLLRAVICGGLYPNIAFRSIRFAKRRTRESVRTVEGSVKLILSSVICENPGVSKPGYMVYHERQQLTSSFFLTEITANVGSYGIIIFGDRVKTTVEDDQHFLTVGDIVKFKCDPATAQLMIALRDRFNRLLEKKIEEPSPINWQSSDGKFLSALIELITNGCGNQFEENSSGDEEMSE